jgi:hypothetical protein
MDNPDNDLNFNELVKQISYIIEQTPAPVSKKHNSSTKVTEISEEIMEFGLTNTQVLKLINDTFSTNYTSINTYDLLEAISKEWNKLS